MKQRRILIIRPDRIGDVVLTTPLIRAVKQSFPGCFVGVMVGSNTAPLLQHNPNIDILITDDPLEKDGGQSGFRRQVKKIRELNFDTGLMPLPRERHAWMMFLSGIRTRIGVGGKIYQLLTATKTVSRNKYIPLRHEADYVMDLGRKIGVTNDDLTPELFLTDKERENARIFFEKYGFDLSKPLIGINPSSNMSVPNWRPEKYVQLAERLIGKYNLFINIGPNNQSLEDRFSHLKDNAVIYTSTDLRELIALCSLLSVLISSSTGTMHIAAALNVPNVSLFCPLPACSAELWGPIGSFTEVILPPEGYCQGRCPGNPKMCPLDEISVSEVLTRLNNVIKT